MLHLSSSSPGLVVLDRPAAISRVIARLRGTPGAFAIPLFSAALVGNSRLLLVTPGGRAPARLLDHTAPPTVIVLGGDPGAGKTTPSPEAFPQARRLLTWAASTMLHASGGQASHYAAVVKAASLVRRVLLIETATGQEDAWLEIVRAEGERRERAGRTLPTLVLSARLRGGVHPVEARL